jgi:hypothetical protein
MASYDRTDQFLVRLTSFLLVTALILGCTTPPPPSEKGIFDEWKARVAESQAYSPSPKKHTRESTAGDHRYAAAKADVLQPPPEKLLPTRKITMKMNDIDVPVLLRALSRIANQISCSTIRSRARSTSISPKLPGIRFLKAHCAPRD